MTDAKITKRLLAVEAARSVIAEASALLDLLTGSPASLSDEDVLASSDIGPMIFEMSRSIEGLSGATDEMSRNFWLDMVARESKLRSQKPGGGDAQDELAHAVGRMPVGTFARLRFGACFPDLALKGEAEDWSRAVVLWTATNKWDQLAAIWKKLSGILVSDQTMKVGYSKPRARGKRVSGKG